MKIKILLSVMVLGFIVSAFGQKPTMELTFTAENNGQYIPLDSIFIENLTQGGDTTLYAPDTVLVLDYITSIGNNEIIGGNTLFVSQNYPNPFKKKTKVDVCLLENEHIKIIVQDILGRELAQYENQLNRGNHSFTFFPGDEKYYLLTVTGKQSRKTIKMLNASSNTKSGKKCELVYNSFNANTRGYKSENTKSNFTFSLGDELKYTGYSYIGDTSIIDTPLESSSYTFLYLATGPCQGMFTITDIDGNIYNVVEIGDQCWMAENLRVISYKNGTPIPNVPNYDDWGNLTTGAYVWYDNDISWKGLYGALYNWRTTVDVNGLCPEGWHVPENEEITELTNFIGGVASPNARKLKSCRQVNSPLGGECTTSEHPRWNGNSSYHWGTDDYGFSGLPAGYRYFYGSFTGLGNIFFFWSATESSGGDAYARALYSVTSNIEESYIYKETGGSVRCIKN